MKGGEIALTKSRAAAAHRGFELNREMELSSRSRCIVSSLPPPIAFLFFSLFIFAGQFYFLLPSRPCAAAIGTSGFSGGYFFIFI